MNPSQYQFSVSPHGKWQLEIEVIRPLSDDPAVHDLDVYLFTPEQLDIDAAHYPVAAFFQDLVAYTRHQTPRIPLKQLVSPQCALSPFTRILQALQAEDKLKLDEPALLYELRTAVNAYRGQLGALLADLDAAIQARNMPLDTLEALADEALTDMQTVMEQVEEIEKALLAPGISDRLRLSGSWMAEALSRRTERTALRLFQIFAEVGASDRLLVRCRDTVVGQVDFRRQRKMPGSIDPQNPEELEHFIYRGHELKKWAGSAMYMSLTDSKLSQNLTHVFFGMAAAIAMTFTTIAGVIAAWFWESASNKVLYVSLVAIIAYIFKDRIKDILRAVSLRLLPHFIADRNQRLIDPRSGKQCGRTSETVTYPSVDQLPDDVRRLRLLHKDLLPEQGLLETVVHYHRSVHIDGPTLLREHERLMGLTEILRFDMRRWAYRMDSAYESLSSFDDMRLETVQACRVYHINLILSIHLRGSSEPSILRKFRIVANVDRILRVEDIF